MEVARHIEPVDPQDVVETDLSGRGFAKGFARAGQILHGQSDYPFRVSEVRVVSVGSQERSGETVKVKDLSARTEETLPLSALSGAGAPP